MTLSSGKHTVVNLAQKYWNHPCFLSKKKFA